MEVMLALFSLGVLTVGFVVIYNSLIFRRNNVEQAWGSVEAYLKKRYDLIPTLVESANQYVKHEQGLLSQIAELRAKGSQPSLSQGQQLETGEKLSQALGQLMLVVENYPDLKANSVFLNVQQNVSEAESQLSASRRAFNAAVTHYNNGVEMFPHQIVARILGLKRRAVFDAGIPGAKT